MTDQTQTTNDAQNADALAKADKAKTKLLLEKLKSGEFISGDESVFLQLGDLSQE